MNTANDAAIIETAQDALETKWAAVQAGYFDDPYLQTMAEAVLPPSPQPQRQQYQELRASSFKLPPQKQRRHVQPLIKRGTHARVCCMDRVIHCFLNHFGGAEDGSCQIVVLGAGYDTSYFRILFSNQQQEGNTESGRADLATSKASIRWYEVDHAVLLCQEKATIIENSTNSSNDNRNSGNKSPSFADHIVIRLHPNAVRIVPKKKKEKKDDEEYSGGCSCTLIGHDLRESGLLEKLRKHGFDSTLPTLFLSECVQMYLPVSRTQELLASLARSCSQACLCSYEPILGGPTSKNNNNNHNQAARGGIATPSSSSSSFGSMMETNLRRAGLAAPDSGLVQIRTLAQHMDLAWQAGWNNSGRAIACDLWTAYSHPHSQLVSPQQRQCANRCEFLDEWEEFTMIMQHYCFMMVATTTTTATTTAPTKERNPGDGATNVLQQQQEATILQLVNADASKTTTLVGFPVAASLIRQP
ncbi:hypothetical protein ACA910_006276 [Epithemia clementina (nom. ined.)]